MNEEKRKKWPDGIDRTPYKYGPRDPMRRKEVKEMIENANRLRDRCLIAIHYLSGARVSEIVELKRKDITIKDDEFLISFRRRKKRSQGPLVKTDKLIFSKNAPFSEKIIDYIEKSNFEENDYIFPSSSESGHLTRQRVWQIIKELNENTSSHFYRHTRLNKLSKKGFSLEDVRKWSGRKTPPVEYMETPEEEIREIGKEVD